MITGVIIVCSIGILASESEDSNVKSHWTQNLNNALNSALLREIT